MYGYLIYKLRSWSIVCVLLLAVMGVHTVSVGDVCTKDADCSTMANSYCTNGACTCKSGYGSATGKDCLKKLSSYNQYCDSNYHCNGVNQTCTFGKCQCAVGIEWSDLAQMCKGKVYLGDLCTKDADCSSLTNSYCAKMYECTTGTCACKSGYGSATGQDCLKKLSSYYQNCDDSYYCNGVNQTCTSGKCQCAEWNEWSDRAGMCKWREGQLLTESCGPVYSRCFWQSSFGGECSGVRAGYCQCATGTILDMSYSFVACRKPRLGEHCESSPLCESHFDTRTISDDTSNFRPTCQNDVCACPKSHELVSVNGWKLCLSKFDDDLAANGEPCKNWSQCHSRFCVKCPGASSGVCMNKSRSSLRMSSVDYFAAMTLLLLCNISLYV